MAVRLEHPSVSSARELVQPKEPILLLEQEQREHIDGKLTLLARRSIWLPQLDIDTPTRLFMSADDFFPVSYRTRLIDNLFLIKTCGDLDLLLQGWLYVEHLRSEILAIILPLADRHRERCMKKIRNEAVMAKYMSEKSEKAAGSYL